MTARVEPLICTLYFVRVSRLISRGTESFWRGTKKICATANAVSRAGTVLISAFPGVLPVEAHIPQEAAPGILARIEALAKRLRFTQPLNERNL